MARPSKLTDEVRTRIAQTLASGCTLDVAATTAGVHRGTLATWLTRGEDAEHAGSRAAGDQPYILLAAEVRKAQATSEVRALAAIQKAASHGSWQAAAWYLERAFPERWATSKKERLPVGGRPVGAQSAPDRQSKLRAV